MANLQQTARLNDAKIMQLEAQSQKLMKEMNLLESDLQIQAFRAAIEALREQNKNADAQFKQLMELGNNVSQGLTGTTTAAV
jgi:ribonuclease HI